jgi:hypothetical protein
VFTHRCSDATTEQLTSKCIGREKKMSSSDPASLPPLILSVSRISGNGAR